MINLDFKYVAAWNFLCFGPQGIELFLEKMGNILVVKGENWHDINPVTGKPGSNGTGKSCLQDIFSYALFGRITREKIALGELIHKEEKKKMKVEVIWDKYRVVRTRKPDSLRLWESVDGVWNDETEITCGAGVNETQKRIEAILGMNYKSFVGVTVFDDRNDHAFMEMDGPTKRVIVENLLSLEKYRDYNKVAKSIRLEADKAIKQMSSDYDRSKVEYEYAKKRVQQVIDQQSNWRRDQNEKVDNLFAEIDREKSRLKLSDNGAALVFYTNAQNRIAELNQAILTDSENRNRISIMVEEAKTRRDTLKQELNLLVMEKDKIANDIRGWNNNNAEAKLTVSELQELKPGVMCDKCYGLVDIKNADHVIEETQKGIDRNQAMIDQMTLVLAEKVEEIATLTKDITSRNDMIRLATSKDVEIQQRINKLRGEIAGLENINKPDIDKDLALIEQRINDLTAQANSRRIELLGPTPYDQIILDTNDEVNTKSQIVDQKRDAIVDAEAIMPYFKFWVDAFGDDGIRKFVIDGIIPALNSQIAYWLDILIYGNLKLRFDNMLEPTIERVPFDDDPFVYSIMSGGERRRMNLSVIHAFSHIQMLNCGACPSILFLDEVVTNIDTNGKQAAFDMIQELATTRQVFLTTHDVELLDLLQGCQVINLERRDGITKMVKKAA
jgi:DNA repair exonuclease SbcCD ATPase subunit